MGNPDNRLKDYPEDAFSRADETGDAAFYATDRFVNHLDSLALWRIEELIGTLIVEEDPKILDLMASWDSHIPGALRPSEVVGLGLNENELKENKDLTGYVIHDLNEDPRLPFPDGKFDAALCTVSVDYMTRPVGVFAEVGRVLKPGGLYLVTFSNRFFPPKVVKVWREAAEEERVMLVEEFFRVCGAFAASRTFMWRGRPRPKDDKYAGLGIPSDPIYAVHADKLGVRAGVERPPALPVETGVASEVVEEKRRTVGITLRCPYCDGRLSKWSVPQTPFTEWENEFFYVCFNDECAYFIGGWDSMSAQGNPGSYRFMYNHLRNTCHPLPVPSYKAFRDGIVDEK